MLVVVDTTAPVATLDLQDPDRRNALSTQLLDEFVAGLQRLDNEHAGSVVLLRGVGRVFCSGIDLIDSEHDPKALVGLLERLAEALIRLRRLRQVVVAQVQGAALAGGCALLSASDIVCVEAGARIGYPVLQLGLSAAVSLPTLMAAVGPAHARTLMLSGSIIDGNEAFRMGIAHRLATSNEELTTTANELCEDLVSRSVGALAATKVWMNELEGADSDDRFQEGLAVTLATARSEEARHLLKKHWSDRRHR